MGGRAILPWDILKKIVCTFGKNQPLVSREITESQCEFSQICKQFLVRILTGLPSFVFGENYTEFYEQLRTPKQSKEERPNAFIHRFPSNMCRWVVTQPHVSVSWEIKYLIKK